MTYGIPEPGSYFKVPGDGERMMFDCAHCGEQTDVEDMAEPDEHGGEEICTWCEEAMR